MELTTENSKKELIRQIVTKNGIQEQVTEIIIKDSGIPGGTKTQFITVNFASATASPLHLFLKTKLDNIPNKRLAEGSNMMFLKETRFFMEYLPAAEEFCKSLLQDDLINIYPKCYYGDEKMIIFENLLTEEKGFCMIGKEEQHDFESAKFALVSLAKHHAISHAFIKEVGSPAMFFKRFPNLDFEPFSQPLPTEIMGHIMEIGILRDCSILQKSNHERKENAIAVLSSFSGKAWKDFINCTGVTAVDNFLVLYHGDYFSNNMLFRKDRNTSEILDHILIDLQMTSYGSPCLDIAYYFFTSVKPQVRRERLHELLQKYYDTLICSLEKLGCSTKLTFQELLLNFRAKISFGFWISIVHEKDMYLPASAEIKPEPVDDRKEFLRRRNDCIVKWLEDHPLQLERVTGNIIEQVEEFNGLRISQS